MLYLSMYAAHTANKDGTYNVVPYLSQNVLNRCPDLLCNTLQGPNQSRSWIIVDKIPVHKYANFTVSVYANLIQVCKVS